MAATTYDEIPYSSTSFPQAHPVKLATVATLFGLAPPPPSRCRFLELGCGDGAHLLPLAETLPESTFVGLDLASTAVASGRATAEAVGLRNVTLHAGDLMDFPDQGEPFDYIVAHGLYSWVPAPARRRILELCARRLAPGGVAYVSYNALPGWRMRGMIRDMMLYHAEGFDDTRQKIAQSRALLQFLGDALASEDSPYARYLRREVQAMQGWDDGYLRHDFLSEENQALYFRDFMAEAGRQGLHYLGEPELSHVLADNFAPAVRQTLAAISPDLIAMEQYMDFLRNRTFRTTLLVHQGVAVRRGIDPLRVRPLWVAAAARAVNDTVNLAQGVPETFRVANGSTFTADSALVKSILWSLQRHLPNAVAFARLLDEVRAALPPSPAAPGSEDVVARREEGIVCHQLLVLHGGGLLELHAECPPACTFDTTRRLRASALARYQAEHHPRYVTNRRHRSLPMDAFSRLVLSLLDGRRDRAAVVAAVQASRLVREQAEQLRAQGAADRIPTPEALASFVDTAFDQLSRASFLEAVEP